MPSTIVATAKDPAANSYVTLAEATAYFGDRLNATAWTGAAGDDDRARALLMATKRLEEEEYSGAPTTLEQALAWPRYGAYDVDDEVLDADTIPELVKRATYETALWMLGSDRLVETGLEGFEHVQVGPLSVKPRHGRASSDLPDHVLRILAPVHATPDRSSVHLVRGGGA